MPTSFSPTTLGNVSYTYDPAGHVITRGGTLFQSIQAGAITAAAYNNGNRLISQTAAGATVTPSWDGNGNLVCDNYNTSTAACTGRTFTWDSRNRLTGISPAGTGTSFTYDMFNRRLSKGGSGGVTTQYVYDGWNEVQEQNSKGAVSANMLNGLGLDDRFTRTAIASGTTSAFLVDGLGSTLGLAYTGAVKTDYAYQPYGTASMSGTSNTNTYEYTGRELDGSGLQYNRNRYYNPAWGRFVSEDPIGFAGGINKYAYTGEDPTDNFDPLGHETGAAFKAEMDESGFAPNNVPLGRVNPGVKAAICSLLAEHNFSVKHTSLAAKNAREANGGQNDNPTLRQAENFLTAAAFCWV